MKMFLHHSCFIAFLLLASEVFGQAGPPASSDKEAAKVSSIELNQYSSTEYKSKAGYWKEEVLRNESNQDAWINYYKAARYACFSSHSRTITKEKQAELDAIIESMSSRIPDSFAYQYARYLNGNKSDESFTWLKNAYSKQPENIELYDDLLCDAVIRKEASGIRMFAEKISAANIYNSAEVEYNRNVLNSVERDGYLITYGNADTYPLIMMQQLQSFRTDITIICAEWLGSATYRIQLAQQFGISNPEKVSIEKIISSGKGKALYLGLTVPPSIIKKQDGSLYCTGLALKYSKEPLQNLTSLSYNWETLFSKKNISSSEAINRNYLLPMIQLRDYYTSQGRTEDAMQLQNQIIEMSQRFGVADKIKNHMD